MPLKNPLSWGRQGGAHHSFPQARPPRPHHLAPLVLRPCPRKQHLHHGRLDCYKSSLIIGCVCSTELCPGPLPTPLQGTTLPTHSLGDRGQEKAALLPWAAQGPGECRASSVPHWEGSPPASLSGPGPVQTFMPRPPPFSPAHAGPALTAWPRLARAAWVGLGQAGEGVPLLCQVKPTFSHYLKENGKNKDRSIRMEAKLTHAVGSDNPGCLIQPPHPQFLTHFLPYNIYSPQGR